MHSDTADMFLPCGPMMKDGTVRDVGLKQVQAALERACCLQEYDDALSLCGREAPAEGLWAKDEEEALLLTVLLIVAPDHQWEPASPALRALRAAAVRDAPAVVREEVTSLRTQLEALARYVLQSKKKTGSCGCERGCERHDVRCCSSNRLARGPGPLPNAGVDWEVCTTPFATGMDACAASRTTTTAPRQRSIAAAPPPPTPPASATCIRSPRLAPRPRCLHIATRTETVIAITDSY